MDVVLALPLSDLDGRRPSGATAAFALQTYFLEHTVHLLGHPSQKRERVSPDEFLRREHERIFSPPLQETGSGRTARHVFPLRGLCLLLAGFYREGALIAFR